MSSPPSLHFRPSVYLRPRDIGETVVLLGRYGRRARILAGGTDVLVQRDPSVEALIDLEAVGLAYVVSDAQSTRVGAATTQAEIAVSERLATPALRAVQEAASLMATPQIRNVATVGGNLCTASPAADLATPLLALDAEIRVEGSSGGSQLPLRRFFVSPGQTVLRPDQLFVEVIVPVAGARSGCAFLRLARTATDIALVNVAVALEFDQTDIVTKARIALGAVAPIPMRADSAEAALLGVRITRDSAVAAGEIAAGEASPISNQRSTAEHRRSVVAVLVRRALLRAAERAEDRRDEFGPFTGDGRL
jgi:CO/xanthine dehydrogenase FAD-binding subunit